MTNQEFLTLRLAGVQTWLSLVGEAVAEGNILDALDHLVNTRAALDSMEANFVEGLRVSGASWGDIGDILGVSRQAAWAMFSGRLD